MKLILGNADAPRASVRGSTLAANVGIPAADAHVAPGNHLVAFHRDDADPAEQNRPARSRARQLDNDIGLLGFGGVNRLPEQLGAERPRHRRSVAGPAEEIAAYADQ